MCERCDHGGCVKLEEVGEYGAATQEALLSWKDPFSEMVLPAVAGSRGNEAVVAIDDAEWACVVGGVGFCAVLGSGGAFFGEADEEAVVVLVALGGVGVVEGVVELVLCVVGFQTQGHIIQNGNTKWSKGTPSSEWYTVRSGCRVAAVSSGGFDVLPSDSPSSFLCG